MQIDPELSRTVIVSTKLDTKIPLFARASDVEVFLSPPASTLDGFIHVRRHPLSHLCLWEKLVLDMNSVPLMIPLLEKEYRSTTRKLNEINEELRWGLQ
ncbi:Dynamin-like protein ARC5 [Camellia lanceoleosa]|uniref:Dynamin-like protein ARC5 n=1 Tax=Camellia lanceoleosa TaxID=1840588 RepID=A0ACC0IHN0_9ERIC|nr:Dynamin-like protein ARC5 [Camellia lanceoleosa]